jgi:GTP:adenosylcobinamide-phosphate guanylyltransferase
MGWKIIHTDAQGYHSDLKQAVKTIGLAGPVLTMPSDVPAITGDFLTLSLTNLNDVARIFSSFRAIQKRLDLGLSISSTDEYKGVWYAVSGFNVINGAKVQGEGKIETSAIITEKTEVLLNVNTLKDVEIAQKLLSTKVSL